MSTTRPDRQAGFSLISAIFLVVVLGFLGLAMVRFASVQQLASATDAESARLLHLAQSAADHGVYQVFQNAGSCPSSVNLSFPGGYAATVACAASGPFSEPGGALTVYALVVTACNRPAAAACPGSTDGLTYVERQVRLTVSR